MSPTSFSYKPHVDGLRAVAVLLVVLYHVGVPGISGGFIGVDVFFVISGYLITTLLLVESEQTGRVDLAGFYARRVRRLFPAMLVVVLATLALAAWLLLPIFQEQSSLAKSAIATALYLSNFYFWKYTGDYFDGPTDFEPLLHTWSLAVEEQFYFVWPLLIIVLLKVGSARRHHLRRDLLTLLAAVTVVSFAFSIWATRNVPTAAFYLMPSRAWQFGVGGIVGILMSKPMASRPLAGNLLSLAGLTSIVGGGLLLSERGFPGLNALWPTLGAAALITGCNLNAAAPVTALLSWQPLRFVGLVSYSWYLWHWPLLAIARVSSLERNDLTRDALLGALSFVLACLTYRFIETPVRVSRPAPFRATTSTLLAGAAISLVMVGSAVALTLNAKRVANSDPRYVMAEFARNDVPALRSVCNHPFSGEFKGLPDAGTCTYGNPQRIRAVLWGDSHADHLSGLLQAYVATEPGVGVLQRTFSSCRTYGDDPIKTTAAMVKACEDFNLAVEQELTRLKSSGSRGVILSNMWISVFRDPTLPAAANINLSPAYFAASEVQFDAVVHRLVDAGLRVLLVGPFHLMPHEVPACLARHSDADCAASRKSIERQRLPSLEMLRRIENRYPGSVRIWDPLDALCTSEYCPAIHDGHVYYTDALHLTATGAASLLPSAHEQLNWVTGD